QRRDQPLISTAAAVLRARARRLPQIGMSRRWQGCLGMQRPSSVRRADSPPTAAGRTDQRRCARPCELWLFTLRELTRVLGCRAGVLTGEVLGAWLGPGGLLECDVVTGQGVEAGGEHPVGCVPLLADGPAAGEPPALCVVAAGPGATGGGWVVGRGLSGPPGPPG